MIIFDTYAWIEYFVGSEKGKKAEEYLKKNEIGTPFIVLIELSCKAAREGWDFPVHLDFIKSKSVILGLNEDLILNVGSIYLEARKKEADFGLADAIVLAMARLTKGKVLTGDSKHFGHFSEAILL